MKRLFSFKLILPLLALLVLVGNSPTVQADPLLPGTPLAVAPLTLPSAAPFTAGGVLLANTGNVAIATAGFTGLARSAVVMNVGGTLDFYYQFQTLTVASPGSEPHRNTAFNFLGFTTDVFQFTDGTSVAGNFTIGTDPAIFVARPGAGSTVAWAFDDVTGVPAGATTTTFLIRTNATQYTAGTYSVINGGATSIVAFQPTAVPEPTSMFLLGSGLIGTAGVLRRRLKARKSS